MEFPQEENVSLTFCTTTKEEEEFILSVSPSFYEEGFEDDEVFLNTSQSIDMEASEIPPRIRRTSDVIDCVGGPMSPACIKRHSFPSTSGELVYSATSKATDIKEGNQSRRSELTTESLDLGYSSPGAQSSSRSFKGWFRYSTSNDADSVDARPTNSFVEEQSSNPQNSSNKNTSPGFKKSSDVHMPVTRDATCYNMDHEYRGIAVIINNDVFEGPAQNLPERIGSWKDVLELKTMFCRLDFKVVIWNNLILEELNYRLNKCMYKNYQNII